MPLSAGTHLGPYEILAPIGAGGMGEVYKARDTKLDREVAIKVLPSALARDPERLARFEREAKVLASLNHPNIAQIYGIEESDSGRALVMELVPGHTLEVPLPLNEALRIAGQVTEALEAAHDKGIVHRDLKPANIMTTPAGVVKVLDFGLAAVTQPSSASGDPNNSPTLTMGATQAGMILGTAGYMAPEQAAGQPVDKRADIWSFGVVLYEMLTGQRLFTGDSVAHILADVLRAPIDFDKLPAAAPRAIRDLVKRCLDRDVKTRLRDIGEARIAIHNVGKEPEVAATAAPASHLSWVAWVVAGLLLVTTIGVSFMHFGETLKESVRVYIPLPENTSNAVTAISPDGRYLAIAAEQNGKRQLWVRPLDSFVAQPLPGTEGATFPFWSPDGSQIGFFADQKLKKVAATGGQPLILCDAPFGRGGTWNKDGVIVFTLNAGGPIYRVADSGGTSVRVTATEGNRFPSFLPDGEHFLYTNSSSSGDARGIYVGSLDGSVTRVAPENSSASFLPASTSSNRGFLLFLRGRTLMAQPFDATARKTTGDAFPVAEGVGQSGMTAHADVSVSRNGTLVYSSGNLQSSNQLVWTDRQGNKLAAVGQSGTVDQATLSPDGKTIAVSLLKSSDNESDIWTVDVSRGVPSRLTFQQSQKFAQVWSPGGDQIAFYSGLNREIVLKHLKDNRHDEVLLRNHGVNTHPTDWSRDGKFIVFQEVGEHGFFDLWLLPLEGDRKPIPYLKTTFDEEHGQLSPDGRWMAYQSDESGADEIYIQAVPINGMKWQISPAGGTQPRWRRDGRELYYIAADRKLMAVPMKIGNSVEAGTPTPLFDIPPAFSLFRGGRFEYQPTADGQKFLVTLPERSGAAAPLSVVINWQAGLKN